MQSQARTRSIRELGFALRLSCGLLLLELEARRDGREVMALISQSRGKMSMLGRLLGLETEWVVALDCCRVDVVFTRDFFCWGVVVLVRCEMLSSMFFFRCLRT